jgi:hypothetical protein
LVTVPPFVAIVPLTLVVWPTSVTAPLAVASVPRLPLWFTCVEA